MTNTPKMSDYAAEQLANNLRELNHALYQYGGSMPADARSQRVEAYNWGLAELVAADRADMASQWHQRALDAQIAQWGICYPNRAVVLAATASLNLRAAAGLYADDGDPLDDRMAGPGDERRHPDGA